MKRPKSHQAGDLAENIVAGEFLHLGWVVNPCISDYGYDFLIQLIEGSQSKPVFAFLQVKGTDQQLTPNSEASFSFAFDVEHLEYWYKTPIPVYVCIVELPTRKVFIFNAREAVRALQQRLGDDWLNARTRSVTVNVASALDSRRGDEIRTEVDNYWKETREYWAIAERAAAMGRALYISWLWGYMMLENAVAFQTSLSEVLGNQEAEQLLTKAGLKPLKMP